MWPILEPDPHGMDPKIGPKIGPGRISIKPEALLHDIEYLTLKPLSPTRAVNRHRFPHERLKQVAPAPARTTRQPFT